MCFGCLALGKFLHWQPSPRRLSSLHFDHQLQPPVSMQPCMYILCVCACVCYICTYVMPGCYCPNPMLLCVHPKVCVHTYIHTYANIHRICSYTHTHAHTHTLKHRHIHTDRQTYPWQLVNNLPCLLIRLGIKLH